MREKESRQTGENMEIGYRGGLSKSKIRSEGGKKKVAERKIIETSKEDV